MPFIGGIKRHRSEAAPTDFAVVRGQLGIEMAVRLLEGKLTLTHLGPAIELVETDTVDAIGTEGSMASASYTPTFTDE